MTTPMTEQLNPIPPAPGDSRLPRVLRPFRHPAYRWLGPAMACAMFAQGVWVVALVWEVIRLGGGPGHLSAVTSANAAGLLALALVAGVVADRVPQKLILLAVGLVDALGMLAVALLSWADLNHLAALVVVAFLTGAAMAFYYPAYSAWLPALIPEQDLLAVNGFEGMVRPAMGQALGPAAAGLVVGASAPSAALAIAGAAGAAGLVLLVRVPLTAVRRDFGEEAGRGAVAALQSGLADVVEGARHVVRTPWLLSSLLFASLMLLLVIGPLEVLVPFLIKDELGGGPRGHAAVLAGFGIGGALASLLVGQLPMPRRYLTITLMTWGVGCLPFALIGFAERTWVIVAVAFVVGAAFAGPMVTWGTLLQRRVPPHLLGRVSSLDFFVSISLMPVSMALAAPVASLIGIRTTFIVAGVVPVVLAAVAVVWAKLPADEVAHPLD